jgi:uncharacterized protein
VRPQADPERVREALAVASGGARVELRETHISWVFLAGDLAYKLKKPLVLPFLDYGTPARRRTMCREEVRLNRRLAPGIYLGVRGLVPSGEGLELVEDTDPDAIDYVVEMRRYDEARTMSATLERAELDPAELDAVARLLAGFHAGARPATVVGNPADAVQREIDTNYAELLPLTEDREERERARSLWRFQSAFVTAKTDVLEGRAQRGLIRECHGDLRAEHVILGERPSIVDCVEFDPALRTLDVADDLAFLVMDLTDLGGEWAADELTSAYRNAGGDPGNGALLSFYAAHRAVVRAKVLLVRADQLPSGSAQQGEVRSHARHLVRLAERFVWRARLPLLLVVCGSPASGKSHLSDALARASGLVHLSSDVIRKQLAGLDPDEPAPPARYRDEFSAATYAELGRRAAAELGSHGGAIVDATFRHRRDRHAFKDAFAGAGPMMFVECRAPAQVLAERALAREHGERHGSDATLSVVLQEQANWEPLDEVSGDAHVIIRSDRPLSRIVAELVGLLDARLSAQHC